MKMKSIDVGPYIYIAPVHIVVLLTTFLPTIYTLWLSFQKYKLGGDISFVGLDNYIQIFRDPNFIRAVINNVVFVNIVVYGEMVFGLAIASFIAKITHFKRLVISIIMSPYAVSTVLGVLMWKFMLEPDFGFLNGILKSIGLPQILWATNTIHAFIVIIMLSIWLNVPFTFLILYNAILGINTELFDAAEVDGANKVQIFWKITIPTIAPALLVTLLFRYIYALRTFDVVWLLTQGGPFQSTELLSVYLYKRTFRYLEFGVGSSVAWIMVLVTLIIVSPYLVRMYKRMFK